MKTLISLFCAIALSAGLAIAQEAPQQTQAAKQDDYNTVREFKSRVFSIQNRDPNTIAKAIKLLGSGFRGADLSVNTELRTISVRDFPENIAVIEDAIKRLDQAAPPVPDLDLRISVLIASKTANADATVPEDLASVVKELKATLSYTHYGLLTTTVHRTKVGTGIEGSGVAEPALLGMTAADSRPIFYTYTLRGISFSPSGQSTVDVGNFQFSMRVPLDIGNGSIQYQSVGFETPVSLRQGEKVVIGTTTMRDKALVVVVTAKVNR